MKRTCLLEYLDGSMIALVDVRQYRSCRTEAIIYNKVVGSKMSGHHINVRWNIRSLGIVGTSSEVHGCDKGSARAWSNSSTHPIKGLLVSKVLGF